MEFTGSMFAGLPAHSPSLLSCSRRFSFAMCQKSCFPFSVVSLFCVCGFLASFQHNREEYLISQVNERTGSWGEKSRKKYIGIIPFVVVLCPSRERAGESWTLIVHYKIRIRHLFWFENRKYTDAEIFFHDNLIVWVDYTLHRDVACERGVRSWFTVNLICKCSRQKVSWELKNCFVNYS